ncbi:competence protein CoiA [Lacticaseibacillus mingshuiensis]|uniref:Competence protein CoiA n=1 Tax=Lacticaseibacillus mingshuiensis TaxID=2799574 RepID=A0ABW4CG85_9LACO|nr:competence protein CoiA family protein [Lacticaseibacillus mingshuiensis]
MFVAMDSKAQLVTLNDHEQAAALRVQGGQFVCPACRMPVGVRNGAIMPAHFYHLGPPCEASTEPESLQHLTGKRWLADLGAKLGYEVALETYFPSIRQRADVVWRRGEATLVLEFQCSPLNEEKLAARTRGYQQLGLTVFWVLGSRYQSAWPTSKQGLFLSPGFQLWFLKMPGGQLIHWQLAPATLTETRLPGATRVLPRRRDPLREAEQIQTQLHFADKRVVALQRACYERGLHLAGCPWVVHEAGSGLIGLHLPEWQVRVQWLLAFQEAPTISQAAEQDFWRGLAPLVHTPLLPPFAVLSAIRRAWLAVLIDQRWLVKTVSGFAWQRRPPWYPDLTVKELALVRQTKQNG